MRLRSKSRGTLPPHQTHCPEQRRFKWVRPLNLKTSGVLKSQTFLAKHLDVLTSCGNILNSWSISNSGKVKRSSSRIVQFAMAIAVMAPFISESLQKAGG